MIANQGKFRVSCQWNLSFHKILSLDQTHKWNNMPWRLKMQILPIYIINRMGPFSANLWIFVKDFGWGWKKENRDDQDFCLPRRGWGSSLCCSSCGEQHGNRWQWQKWGQWQYCGCQSGWHPWRWYEWVHGDEWVYNGTTPPPSPACHSSQDIHDSEEQRITISPPTLNSQDRLPQILWFPKHTFSIPSAHHATSPTCHHFIISIRIPGAGSKSS